MIGGFDEIWRRSLKDPQGFWGDVAEGARVQAGTFFRTSLDNGQATVIDPFARK